jgi:hypothetical protein
MYAGIIIEKNDVGENHSLDGYALASYLCVRRSRGPVKTTLNSCFALLFVPIA